MGIHFPVHGREGIPLTEIWGNAPFAYHGITIPNMPNLYLLYGPGTNLGHASIIFMLECQANYITSILQHQRKTNSQTVEVTLEAAKRQFDSLQRNLRRTVWMDPSCTSWYKTE